MADRHSTITDNSAEPPRGTAPSREGAFREINFAAAFLISVFLIFLPPMLSAQITSTQVLASAKNDMIFRLKNEQTALLENNPLQLPDWDDVELRMENNRFENDRNEYALRITRNPNALKKQHTQIHQSLIQVADTESVIEFSRALENRYEAILQAKFSAALRQKRVELQEVLKDQKRVITNGIKTGLLKFVHLIFKATTAITDNKVVIAIYTIFNRTDISFHVCMRNYCKHASKCLSKDIL